MNVLIGPEGRKSNSYQVLLEKALVARGLEVGFVRHVRQLFPLFKVCRRRPGAVLHLHWLEAFWVDFEQRVKGRVRFCGGAPLYYLVDLTLALLGGETRLVVTAHNLWPHVNGDGYWVREAFRLTARKADVIIAHSGEAAEEVAREWRVLRSKIVVIPHGDLSAIYGRLESRRVARARLPLAGEEPFFLIFGIIKSYKGVEEVMEFWKRAGPRARLAVVGCCGDPELAGRLRKLAAECPVIHLSIDRWLSDDELGTWLAASSGAIFNYRRTLTSGAASLARSLGVPILIPRRARTVDLGEPHRSVLRYDSLDGEMEGCLARALVIAASVERFEKDAVWDASIAWPGVAEKTAAVYRWPATPVI